MRRFLCVFSLGAMSFAHGDVVTTVAPNPVQGGLAYHILACGIGPPNKTVLLEIQDHQSLISIQKNIVVGADGCASDDETATYIDSSNNVQSLPAGDTIGINLSLIH